MKFVKTVKLIALENFPLYSIGCVLIPSKNALARSCKKRSFFLAPLQELARSCGILRDFAGILQDSCTKFLQDSCKILQDPTRPCRILQDLARSCRGDLFLQDLARAFLLGILRFYLSVLSIYCNTARRDPPDTAICSRAYI